MAVGPEISRTVTGALEASGVVIKRQQRHSRDYQYAIQPERLGLPALAGQISSQQASDHHVSRPREEREERAASAIEIGGDRRRQPLVPDDLLTEGSADEEKE